MLNTTKKQFYILSLAPADKSIPAEGKVLSTWAMVPDIKKRIENAGKAYAKLQGKTMRRLGRIEEAKANGTDVAEAGEDSDF